MKLTDEMILARKRTKTHANMIIYCVVGICVLYVIMYPVLCLYPACCDMVYKFGIFMNSLAQSTIAAYVFYLITVVYPEYRKKKELSQWVSDSQDKLAKLLNKFVSNLLQDDMWWEKTDRELRDDLNIKSKDRRIWKERHSGMYTTSEHTNYVNPPELLVLDDMLEKISVQIAEILECSEFFDKHYLENVIQLKSSVSYSRLSLIRGAAKDLPKLNLDEPKYAEGKTYLDSVFNEELPIRVFVTEENGTTFMNLVRKLVVDIIKEEKIKRRKSNI